MKLPGFKRLYKDDYPKQYQDLVDDLSVPLNIGIESLYTLGTNNTSFRDNIACTVSTITVTVDANGFPTKSTTFPLTLPTAVDGTTVISAVSATTSTVYPTSTPFITGSKKQNSYIIQQIAGLPANVPFNLTIITYQN